eukprot:263422_1
MQLIRALVLLKCIITVFGDPPEGKGTGQPPNQASTPYCSKANVPFENEADALNYAKYYLEDCRYNYLKVGNDYHGMNGFKEVFGDIGYMFNKSTVWDFDGSINHGYMNARAKLVVAHNLVAAKSVEFIQLVEWSKYEVFFKFKWQMVSNVASVESGMVESFARMTWFNDSSGIVKYMWTSTSSSVMGRVLGTIIATTQVITSQLGYLNDDGIDYSNKYIKNPIQFIFICVFCGLTVFIAGCVYILLQFTLSRKN